MIRIIYLIAVLCLFLNNSTFAQSPRFRSLNTATGVLGAVQDMPTNAVADDLGSRDLGNDYFHGGVDFKSKLR